jgi:hypothetical protein
MITTTDRFIKSLSPKEKKEFFAEYRKFVLSELLLAAIEQDEDSVRKLINIAINPIYSK